MPDLQEVKKGKIKFVNNQKKIQYQNIDKILALNTATTNLSNNYL